MSRARDLLDAVLPLPARNELRLLFGRYPKPLRARFPALARLGLSRKAVVFDIGAHIGDFAECVLAYRPHARLFAFEPLPEAFARLQSRMQSYPNATVENVALGRESGRGDLLVRSFGEASSFLPNGRVLRDGIYGLDFSTTAAVPVPVTTIDAYAREHGIGAIELLKLDVQGFELEVLAGADETLPRVRWIYTEAQFQELYAGAPLADDVVVWLTARGFELMEMTACRTTGDGHLMEADLVFRRRAPS